MRPRSLTALAVTLTLLVCAVLLVAVTLLPRLRQGRTEIFQEPAS